MSAFSTLIVAIRDDVCTITLNRPQAHNAYNLQMRDELWQVLGNTAQIPDLRALVFRGSGRSFCAGADLSEFGTAPSPFQARRIRFERDVWSAVRDFPAPTIAVLHGHVIGTGFELAMHCTFRVAGSSTVVRMPEAQLGLHPAAGGTQTIPLSTVSTVTSRLLYLGEALDAPMLRSAQLVDEVVQDAHLDSTVQQLIGKLTRMPAARVRALLSVIRARDDASVSDSVRHERYIGAALARSAPGGSSR